MFFSHNLYTQTNSTVSIFDNLSLIETDYFDIIFPQVSEKTAQHVATHADELYRKAADLLNVENLLRIPVVITQKTDVLNAYFTVVPYSRIVLYDTPPNETLSVFDDTILSVFYHELIHAVSFKNNQKNIFFIDDMVPYLTMADMPPSMSEGIAVLAESLDGKGRLNDSSSMHVIRQAKIENKFPDWSDIAGARTLYTDGSLPYIFGGAFTEYLYTAYGAQKLVEFWNYTTKVDLLSYTGIFKRVYGISIGSAWSDFEKSIVTPDITKSSKPYANENILYQNVSASSEIIVWQDGYTGNVYAVPTQSTYEKPKLLFSTDLTSSISVSKDSNYIILSGAQGFYNEKNVTKVYDIAKRDFIKTKENLRDGTIVLVDTILQDNSTKEISSHILTGVQTSGQYSSLVLYDVSKEDENPIYTIEFEYGSIVFNPIDAGNGLILAFVKNFSQWELFVYDIKTDSYYSYAFTDGSPVISSLHVANENLYMSVALSANSQCVLAVLPLNQLSQESLEMQVQVNQRSGGVFSPVYFTDTNGTEKILHLSRYYEHRELSTFEINESDFTSLELKKVYSNHRDSLNEDFEIQNYNPFKYYVKGLFIPFIGGINLSPIDDTIYTSFALGTGATYVSMDPVQRFLVLLSGGYDLLSENYVAAVSTVLTEQNATLTGDTYLVFNNSSLELGATKVFFDVFTPVFSDFSRLGVSNSFRYFYYDTTSESLNNGSTIDNTAAAYYSNIRKAGSSPYELLGFTLQYQFALEKYFESALPNIYYGNAIKAEAFIPRLLPVQNPMRYTLNVPFTLSVTKYFQYNINWEMDANVILFSYAIQNPISLIHIFFQYVTLDVGGNYIFYSDNSFDVRLMSSLFVSTALNTSLLTGVPIDLGVDFEWNPLKQGIQSIELGLKFGLNF